MNDLMSLLDAGTVTLEEALASVDPSYKSLSKYEQAVVKTANNVLLEAQVMQAQLQKGWESITNDNILFSDEELRTLRNKARKFSFASPLVVATVETYQLLVHAGNRTIKASNDDIDRVIQNYVKLNGKAVFNYLPRIEVERDLWTDSRVFYIHFTNQDSDEVKTRVLVDSNEITNIFCNPDDDSEIWLYERTFTQQKLDGSTETKVYLYPDVNFNAVPELQLDIETQINNYYGSLNNGGEFVWDTPIKSTIINEGIPRLYPILSWVQCYENLLNMVATVYSAISAIALVTKTKADYVKKVAASISQIKTAKNNKGDVGNIANNVVLDGDIKTLNAKSALLSPTDLDVFLYQINMVTHLPPHAYGRAEPATGLSDGQNSNEIMRLAIEAEQKIYEQTERDLIDYRLIQSVKRGELQTLGNVIEVPLGDGYYQEMIVWDEGIDGTYNINYPPVRTKDILNLIQARVTAHTLDNKVPNSDVSTPREYYTDVFTLLGRTDLKERLLTVPDEWSTAPTLNEETPISERLATQALTKFDVMLKEALANDSEGV